MSTTLVCLGFLGTLAIVTVVFSAIAATRSWPTHTAATTTPCPPPVPSPPASRAAVALAALASDARVFMHWSELSLNLSARDHAEPSPQHAGPLRTGRVLAIVHVAMADSVAVTTGSFAPLLPTPAAASASTPVAVIEAAYTTLVALYPAYKSTLDDERARSLSPLSVDSAALAVGQGRAEATLAHRATDGSAHAEPSVDGFESTTPGRWQRDPVARHAIALGGLWAALVDPWIIESASSFRVPPAPELSSAQYAMEYAEAYSLGGDNVTTPTVRDEWRTFIGRFWGYDGTANICAPVRMYFQLAHAVAARESYSCTQVARLLGTLGVVLADAGLAAWDSKYHYMRERPVTAIRASAAHDGNAATRVDATWTPLGAPATNALDGVDFTPPFPAYPSGHAVFGAATAEVLRAFTGARAEYPLEYVSDEYNGVARDSNGQVRPRKVRQFSSFNEIEEENGQSRIYLGIHWASDKTSGIEQGRAVARHVMARIY